MEIIERTNEELTADEYPVVTQVVNNVSNCQALKRLYPDWLEYNKKKARHQCKVTYKQDGVTKIIALNKGLPSYQFTNKAVKKLFQDKVTTIFTTSRRIAEQMRMYIEYNYNYSTEYRNNLKIIVKKGN